jgi:hypothetical protein
MVCGKRKRNDNFDVIMFLSAHFPIELGSVINDYSVFSEPPAQFSDPIKMLWSRMQRVLFNGGEIAINVDFRIHIDFCRCRCPEVAEKMCNIFTKRDPYSRIVFLDSSTGNIDIEISVDKLYHARCFFGPNAVFDPTPRRLTLTPHVSTVFPYGFIYEGTGPLWKEWNGSNRTLCSSARARLDVDGRPNNEPGDTKPHVIFISDNL